MKYSTYIKKAKYQLYVHYSYYMFKESCVISLYLDYFYCGFKNPHKIHTLTEITGV